MLGITTIAWKMPVWVARTNVFGGRVWGDDVELLVS